MKKQTLHFILFTLFLSISCIEDKNLYQEPEEPDPDPTPAPQPDPDPDPNPDQLYIYPFHEENTSGIHAEIVVEMGKDVDLNAINIEIPRLKYNKSWLFMLTQDDCVHAAFSCTWAAINGKPLIHVKGNEYYYDIQHLLAGDIPPGTYHLNKTLGYTDGAGNVVRFAPTTTLAPEEKFMEANVTVNKGFTENYYRFYKKSGLVWEDVTEMLNYDWGIALHDVMAEDVKNPGDILNHYTEAQSIIIDKLSGRGAKALAEPNGNKAYITAANSFNDIQIMTAQAGTEKLFPMQVSDDLHKKLLHRFFSEDPDPYVTNEIYTELEKAKENREAIHLGVHSTASDKWIDFLVWLNDNYGKDGDDSMWFPSLEEYYEYNYNRTHGSVTKTIEGNKLKIRINLPGGTHFYYPSTTINLSGIDENKITSVTASDVVTGMSYGNYEGGTMINIDCRKYLAQHATYYVKRFETDKSDTSLKNDALYFVSRLKDSETKTQLLKRIN